MAEDFDPNKVFTLEDLENLNQNPPVDEEEDDHFYEAFREALKKKEENKENPETDRILFN